MRLQVPQWMAGLHAQSGLARSAFAFAVRGSLALSAVWWSRIHFPIVRSRETIALAKLQAGVGLGLSFYKETWAGFDGELSRNLWFGVAA